MKGVLSQAALGLLGVLALSAFSCAIMPIVSAEEYYSLGLAYYDLGKFQEAEKWFLKAKRADKTRVASEYNLGRIAYETGRTDDAVRIFESILKKDPDNVLALKAAAFVRLKNEDFEQAETYYRRVVELLPETVDATYNYALVLHAMKKDVEALETLGPLIEKNPDDKDALLLLARVEKSLGRPEAVDRYAARLALEDDPRIRLEYAEACEQAGLYARAVENYDRILGSDKLEKAGFKMGEIRFAKARALLVAGDEGGLKELKTALAEGYADKDAIDALASDDRVSVKEEVAATIAEARKASSGKEKKDDAAAEEGEPGLAQKDGSGE